MMVGTAHYHCLFGWVWGVFCLALFAGCSSAEPGKGADLWLRVENGQLVRADFPPDEGGPEVTFLDFRRSVLRPGEGRVPLAGRTEGGAFSVRIGLEDDLGYWVLPVGVEDPAVKGELTWDSLLDFSGKIEATEARLLLQAVDEEGQGGPWKTLLVPLEVDVPQAALAVRLTWDADADVDLWITDPTGTTLSPKNISNVTSSPAPLNVDPDEVEPFAYVDIDSNAGCRIDSIRRETALWEELPPEGTYQIGVDLASPCATERTSFAVSIFLDGHLVTTASGNLFAFDARESASGSGAPIPVMSFAWQDGQLQSVP